MDNRQGSILQGGELDIINERLGDGISAILAVDGGYGIGIDGDMLFWIKEDLSRFKEITWGKNLYMGRKTFEGTGSLPGRKMIVLSRGVVKGADYVINDFDEFKNRLKNDKNGILIGGASLVNMLKDDIKYMYLTVVTKTFKADRKIFDPLKNGFEVEKMSDEKYDEENGLSYRYVNFKRI